MLSNNIDATSTTKCGFLVRRDAQIVTLQVHCACATLKSALKGGGDTKKVGQGIPFQKDKSCVAPPAPLMVPIPFVIVSTQMSKLSKLHLFWSLAQRTAGHYQCGYFFAHLLSCVPIRCTLIIDLVSFFIFVHNLKVCCHYVCRRT